MKNTFFKKYGVEPSQYGKQKNELTFLGIDNLTPPPPPVINTKNQRTSFSTLFSEESPCSFLNEFAGPSNNLQEIISSLREDEKEESKPEEDEIEETKVEEGEIIETEEIGEDLESFFCGGALITNAHLLTAAHCIQIPKLVLIGFWLLNLE